MTRDDITRMAREAGSEAFKYPNLISETDWQIFERFAKLIRNDYSKKHAQLWLKRIDEAVKAEREACAEICDRFQARDVGMQPAECAGAIRARGKND
jgi:hypothetical protein